MGNFKFGYNFVTIAAIEVDTEDANYPMSNLVLDSNPKRQYRTTVQTQSRIYYNFGAVAKAVKIVELTDVNFVNILIAGNNTSDWTTPLFPDQAFTISKNIETQRYNLCAVLTGFNCQRLRLTIPAQTPLDLSVFRVGSMVCCDTVLELADSPAFPYKYSASEAMKKNEFESGGEERINLGDLIWRGSFGFDLYAKTAESDFWILNSVLKHQNIVFFENLGDTSKSYLCRRDSGIEVLWHQAQLVRTDKIALREIR